MPIAYVIGAGTAGATAARILKNNGWFVEVFEKRSYIAGNCHDYICPKTGCVVHSHGPHAIHTSSEKVWSWLKQFSPFNEFSVEVWANTALGVIPIPFNDVSEKIIGKKLADEEIRELVFRDYSEKMWGVPLETLPPTILNRLPVRRSGSVSSFTTDLYQGLPKYGFVEMFRQIFDGIPVHLNIDDSEWKTLKNGCDLLVYTGKIDDYFSLIYGNLQYRSLNFEHLHCPKTPYVQLNECNRQNEWTRAIDHSYWYNQNLETTVVTKEFPVAHIPGQNEPYYPMIFGEYLEQFEKYQKLADQEKNTLFVGRTATYKYLTIDQTISKTAYALKKLGYSDEILG